jgi:hypothetical protein
MAGGAIHLYEVAPPEIFNPRQVQGPATSATSASTARQASATDQANAQVAAQPGTAEVEKNEGCVKRTAQLIGS